MPSPRDAILNAEQHAALLPGDDERFSGWGLMGMPFRSGDVIAVRRFPVTSVGPGYTSVWYRSPRGQWTFYSDVPPQSACPRYFGNDIANAVVTSISLEWPAEDSLHIEVPSADLVCDVVVGPTVATRAMNLMSAALPERAWRSPRLLGVMANMAGPMLRAGNLRMSGLTPNGQSFIANPRKMWMVRSASLRVDNRTTTDHGAVSPQAHLGDFRIPQRGVLAVGNAAFDVFDPALHSAAVSTAGTTAAPSD